MIRLEDFLHISEPEKIKIKLNMNAANIEKKALDYLIEDSPEWLKMNAFKTKQANNNLNKAEYLLAFAQYYPYGPQYYMFGGLYAVEKVLPEVFDTVGYKLTLLPKFEEYRKRLIIKLDHPIGRDGYNRFFTSIINNYNPEVFEILPENRLLVFPGYSKVRLTHRQLQTIYKMASHEWKDALSAVKGVYCITDRSNGKLYIGSASGDNAGIWQRWASYADVNDLTGGNVAFEELKHIDKNSIIDNFSYSIIEIFDMRTKQDYILERESHWKRVFMTREFGMNKN